jgi:hypothetical protein
MLPPTSEIHRPICVRQTVRILGSTVLQFKVTHISGLRRRRDNIKRLCQRFLGVQRLDYIELTAKDVEGRDCSLIFRYPWICLERLLTEALVDDGNEKYRLAGCDV